MNRAVSHATKWRKSKPPNIAHVPALQDLKTVDFDVVLFTNFFLQQEGLDRVALITLKLKNLCPCFFVLQDSPVAAMFFLNGLQNALQIESFRQTSYCCNRFTAVTLLNADVDVALLQLNVSGIVYFCCVCKCIWKPTQVINWTR